MYAVPSGNLGSISLVLATYYGWYACGGDVRCSPYANEARARMDHDDLRTAPAIVKNETEARAPEIVRSPSIAMCFFCRTLSLSLAVSVP